MLIDKMYSTCASTDKEGEDESGTTAQFTAFNLKFFRSDAYNAYTEIKNLRMALASLLPTMVINAISLLDLMIPSPSIWVFLALLLLVAGAPNRNRFLQDLNISLDLEFLPPDIVAGAPTRNRFLQDLDILDTVST